MLFRFSFLLLLVLCSCTTVKVNESYLMPKPYTYPEERNVLMAVPVIPVIVDYLEWGGSFFSTHQMCFLVIGSYFLTLSF